MVCLSVVDIVDVFKEGKDSVDIGEDRVSDV